MEEELLKKIKEQEVKLDTIQKSLDKIHRYFLITFWVTIIAFVLPLIALFFLAPYFLNSYLGSFEGLL